LSDVKTALARFVAETSASELIADMIAVFNQNAGSMVLPSPPFPCLITSLGLRVRKRRRTTAEKILRLIQIRSATPILKKYHLFVKHNSQQAVSHRFEFRKRSQLFIGMHNLTLSVAAMCVDNPDRSPIVRLLPSCGLERRLFTFWLAASPSETW